MTDDQLEALSLGDLRDLAERQGLVVPKSARRAVLVTRLRTHLAEQVSRQKAPMPAALQGSSTTTPASPPPSTPAQTGPEPGLPIPDRYGRDRLILMVQDPHHLFAYWEIEPATIDALRGRIGEAGTPVLLLDSTTGSEQREIDLRGGNYYLSVAASTAYQARVGLRDRHGVVHLLVTSNQVVTPRETFSGRGDETWMTVEAGFAELAAALPGHNQSSLARLAQLQAVAWAGVATGPQSSSGVGSHSLSSRSWLQGGPPR